jgi:hypothetical protein
MSYAHSNTAQPFHSDNAWFQNGADINFFLMVKQAKEGGQQIFYPISRLLEDLNSKEPQLLHDLQNIQVCIKKGNTSLENNTTILRKKKDSFNIYWNYYRTQKSSPDIQRMCESFFQFLSHQEQTNSVIEVKCNSGDCFAFNDSLLLHGRKAFTATKSRDRILFQSMWNYTDTS